MFKVIPEFPDYEINNEGFVKNIHTGKEKKSVLGNDNYLRIHLYRDKKPYSNLVHRLVAKLFLKQHNKKYDQVDHIDGNRNNNHVSNLRWVDHNMNQRNTHSISSSTGEQGIYKNKKGFNASIQVNKNRQIKYFTNIEDAKKWRKKLVDELYERPN